MGSTGLAESGLAGCCADGCCADGCSVGFCSDDMVERVVMTKDVWVSVGEAWAVYEEQNCSEKACRSLLVVV